MERHFPSEGGKENSNDPYYFEFLFTKSPNLETNCHVGKLGLANI